MNQPKRKRRFFSYSLRGLFIVVTILCVALGYWSHRANRQQAVVKWVKENGGIVFYKYEHENGRLAGDRKPPYPKWAMKILGKDYFATVNYVELNQGPTAARMAQVLRRSLDLTPLAQLTRLEFLSLNNQPISDLSPLKHLKCLRYLYLHNTQVTQE